MGQAHFQSENINKQLKTEFIIPSHKIQVDNNSVTRKKYSLRLLGFLSKQLRREDILNASKELDESREGH